MVLVDRLRELRLFSLGKRLGVGRALTAVCHYLIWCKDNRARLFSEVFRNRTGGKGHSCSK